MRAVAGAVACWWDDAGRVMNIVERLPPGETNLRQWAQWRMASAAQELGIPIRNIEYSGHAWKPDGTFDRARSLFKAAGYVGFGPYR